MPSAEKLRTRCIEYAECFRALEEVQAIVLAGSLGGSNFEEGSDIDLYVYADPIPSPELREGIAKRFSQAPEINNAFWEIGDEWFDSEYETEVDLMYRTPDWIQQQLDRVLQQHQASVGYSTCFWHNVLRSKILFDRTGWFEQLQRRSNVPYPEELRKAIIAKNKPILRINQSSYRKQIQKAIHRQDLVSINHRVAAFLASYFDILFAINRIPHPGEKRLVAIAKQQCAHLPANFEEVEKLIRLISNADLPILKSIDALCDGLDLLLKEQLDL